MATAGSSVQSAEPPKRLKVAIVYPFFAHYREPVLRELLAHGRHDYLLVGDTRDPSGTIPVLDFADERRFIHTPCVYLGRGLMWQRRLVGLALRGGVDCFIFLGNASWPATWIAAVLARLRGCRVLFWTHGWVRPDTGPKQILRAMFYRIAHGLLLYGDHARRIGCSLGFKAENLHVVYNSLDCEGQLQLLQSAEFEAEGRSTRLRLFGTAQTPVVLASARLTAGKRFDLLIGALGILGSEGIVVNLLVIGEGPERDRLEKLSQDCAIRTCFAGAIYDESQLAGLFQCAAVTVSPGNVGLTCMHSMGYGAPVITHDDPCDQGPEWEAIIPGKTGDFFRKNCVEDLARRIAEWTRTESPSQATREACLAVVTSRYHPRVQRVLIEQAVAGAPAGSAIPPLPATVSTLR
jgi:glycosyltransferase involved in cell wall biosynthesis